MNEYRRLRVQSLVMRFLCGAILVTVLARAAAGSAQDRPLPAQPARGFAAADTPEALLQHADVQRELKLSSQKAQQINAIVRAIREKHKDDFDKLRTLTAAEGSRKRGDLTRIVSQETMSALSKLLQPGQLKRLEQIHLQRQGLKAFLDPKIEQALQLSDDQKDRLKIIRDDTAQQITRLFRGGPDTNFQEALKAVQRVRRSAVEKSVDLLSPEQRKIWNERIGEPFPRSGEPSGMRPPKQQPGNSAGGRS